MFAAHRKQREELISRRGNDFADGFPEIAAALLELPDVVLDCELVMLTADGRPDFERLWRRSRLKRSIWIERSARTAPACLYAFDLLELEEKDVRTLSLDVRKAMLGEVIAKRVDALIREAVDPKIG